MRRFRTKAGAGVARKGDFTSDPPLGGTLFAVRGGVLCREDPNKWYQSSGWPGVSQCVRGRLLGIIPH